LKIRRDSFFFTVLLGAISALPPLSIDMGLPGIPAIEAHFADAAGRGALTLSFFLAGFAASPLICGPLTDRFGRRTTLLVGLVVFILAAGTGAAAPTFDILLGCRLVQGFAAGACAVVPFAMVRDVFEGNVARNRMSQIVGVVGIAPMVAPVFGGWVLVVGDWRAIFASQAAFGLILLVFTALCIDETQPLDRRRAINPTQLLGTYRDVLTDGPFRRFTLINALSFACMFSYISASPGVFMGSFGLSSQVFSLLFAITSCGVLLGSLLNARLSARHVSPTKVMSTGMVLMVAGTLAALCLVAIGADHPFSLMPCVALVIFCYGLLNPGVNHEAMHNLPHVAGAASGLIRGTQMLMGALASASIAALKPLDHPALMMTATMTVFVIATAAIYIQHLRLARRARPT